MHQLSCLAKKKSKISNGHKSASHHPIDLVFGSRWDIRGRRIERRCFRLSQTFAHPGTRNRRKITLQWLSTGEVTWTLEVQLHRCLSTSKGSREEAAASSGMADIPNVWRHVPADVLQTSRQTSGILLWWKLSSLVLTLPHSVLCVPSSEKA